MLGRHKRSHKNRLLPALVTSTVLCTALAQATSLPPLVKPKYTCPVGGERFQQYGNDQTRLTPDDKPIDDPFLDYMFRDDIGETGAPECPSNGLPLYREFLPAEIEKLKTLIAQPDFIALLKPVPQPFRSYWIAQQLGDAPEDRLALAMGALEFTHRPRFRRKALELVVDAYSQVQPVYVADQPSRTETDKETGLVYTIAPIRFSAAIEDRTHFVDALRRLGRFDEALSELRKLPIDRLNPVAPKPVYGPTQGEGDMAYTPVLNEDEIFLRDGDKAVLEQVRKLETVILRRDSSDGLLELFGRLDDSAIRCRQKNYIRSAANKAFCRRPDVVAEIARLDAEHEKFLAEAKQSDEQCRRDHPELFEGKGPDYVLPADAELAAMCAIDAATAAVKAATGE